MGPPREPSRVTWRTLFVAVAVSAAVTAALGRSGAEASPDPRPDPRPNVLVVISDDQTLASMQFMPKVLRRIGERGATFRHNLTNWPLCCPSRSTYYTGQYAVNHGVRGNNPPGGYAKFKELHATSNLATWMRDGGYLTGHIGKYLNGYPLDSDLTEVPPGWDEWYATAKKGQKVYKYELNENGALVPYGAEVTDFKGDVMTAKAVDFISRRAPEAQPFFLSVSYTAPHSGGPNPSPQPPLDCQGSAKPAPRHAAALDTEPLPQPPSFNEADVTDKPAAIQALELLGEQEVADLKRQYRCRMESLLHVDEGVSQMLDALAAAAELKNTIVIYTSDNGYLLGEHRIRLGKNRPYEEALRVPLLIRGPGIPKGVTVRELAINADLAPTILDAADTSAGLVMDGSTLLPVAAEPNVQRGRELLIEKGAVNNEGEPDDPAGFVGIRNRAYKYVEHGTGEVELYDLRSDPYEETSLHAEPAYDEIEAALAARLADLRECAGESCRTWPELALELDYDKGKGGCARRPVTARVTGPDSGGLELVAFELDGVDIRDRTEAPFSTRVRYRDIRRNRDSEVSATAELLDGRVVTRFERVRRC